mmetsp:Transcript_18726/g.38973  ORF Transcript_18726/g.38973 Transcript_18726/m.38973 type:complete len:470 (-) Transcript_18726:8-1417(-)
MKFVFTRLVVALPFASSFVLLQFRPRLPPSSLKSTIDRPFEGLEEREIECLVDFSSCEVDVAPIDSLANDFIKPLDSTVLSELECLVDDTTCFDASTSTIDLLDEEEDTRNAILVHCGEYALPAVPAKEPSLKPLWHDEESAKPAIPSGFFEIEVATMFNLYSTSSTMDAAATSLWLSRCFSDQIGPHSQLVTAVLAEHGTKGLITYPEFRSLYVKSLKAGNLKEIRRDFDAHAPSQIPPSPLPQPKANMENIWDECIIFDHDQAESRDGESFGPDSPSHLRVEMLTIDKNVPKVVRDGEFMFVDEDSCIGCGYCAHAAPQSFKMLESTGRARAYSQSRDQKGDIAAAVNSCPVDCIKAVSFDELKLFEDARENGHSRHMDGLNNGNGTPIHVAGMTSDNNHRSSWYHTLKQSCLMTDSCPRRGCYDCPHYTEKGANPFFKAKQQISEAKRVEEYMDTVGKPLRKRCDL